MTLLILSRLWAFLKTVPWWVYVIVIAVIYHLAALRVAESRATEECNAKWRTQLAAEREAQAKQVADLKAKQQQVITQTVIEYRDRVKVIHDKAVEVKQDIQSHVGRDDPMLPGWVRHDFDVAASGCDVSDDTGRAACSTLPVAASAVTQTAADNFKLCHADQERLTKLQDLARSLAAPAALN